jgi:hypothetical protein
MKDNDELTHLRAVRPDLFDADDPVQGLAAVQDAATYHHQMLRALGNLKRSYSAKVARSPHLQAMKEERRAAVADKIAAMQQAYTPPVANPEQRLASDDETDAFMTELAKEFSK